jgi:hypothetical protein
MEALTVAGVERGAEKLIGEIQSGEALRLRGKVFGEENLEYSDKSVGVSLTVSLVEAAEWIQENGGIDVKVALRDIDIHRWEHPQLIDSK